jgi:hypothetical protein
MNGKELLAKIQDLFSNEEEVVEEVVEATETIEETETIETETIETELENQEELVEEEVVEEEVVEPEITLEGLQEQIISLTQEVAELKELIQPIEELKEEDNKDNETEEEKLKKENEVLLSKIEKLENETPATEPVLNTEVEKKAITEFEKWRQLTGM